MYRIINSAWQYNDDDTITCKVAVPANTTATIILKETRRASYVNDLENEIGIKKVIETPDQTEILLGSGEYVFTYCR